MEEQAILCLGAFTLIGCGAGLMGLHQGNPRLSGLNMMGSAILIGGVAASTLAAGLHAAALQPLGTLLILVAFWLCHKALKIFATGASVGIGFIGWLLAAESLSAVLQIESVISSRVALVIFSTALALEMGVIAWLVKASFTMGPARFILGLFYFLIPCDVIRGCAAALGLLAAPRLNYWVETVTYGLLIAFGIAVGFGFFSMTTFRLTADLDALASTDPLTQVFNRRSFLERCGRELERSQRTTSLFSMLLVDLDHFKQFNDEFGHGAGDEALCAAASGIQNSVRGIDVVCRWGGEEFAVLLPNASAEAAHVVADRICDSIRGIAGGSSGAKWAYRRLTASIGAATFDGTQGAINDVLERADSALYAAKRAGRDCVVLS